MTKVAGIMYQTNKELFELHRPENGFISGILELKSVEFLLAEMSAVTEECKGEEVASRKDID